MLDKEIWLWLSLQFGVGNTIYSKLYSHFGSVEAIYDCDDADVALISWLDIGLNSSRAEWNPLWTLNPQTPLPIQGKHWSGGGEWNNFRYYALFFYRKHRLSYRIWKDIQYIYHIKIFSGEEANRKICLKRLLTCGIMK